MGSAKQLRKTVTDLLTVLRGLVQMEKKVVMNDNGELSFNVLDEVNKVLNYD